MKPTRLFLPTYSIGSDNAAAAMLCSLRPAAPGMCCMTHRSVCTDYDLPPLSTCIPHRAQTKTHAWTWLCHNTQKTSSPMQGSVCLSILTLIIINMSVGTVTHGGLCRLCSQTKRLTFLFCFFFPSMTVFCFGG